MVPIVPKMGGPPEDRPSAMINGARQVSIALRGINYTPSNLVPGPYVWTPLQREHTPTGLAQSATKVSAY